MYDCIVESMYQSDGKVTVKHLEYNSTSGVEVAYTIRGLENYDPSRYYGDKAQK